LIQNAGSKGARPGCGTQEQGTAEKKPFPIKWWLAGKDSLRETGKLVMRKQDKAIDRLFTPALKKGTKVAITHLL